MTLADVTDDSLMLAWRDAGEQDAFATLYERQRRRLYGFLARQCPGHVADDVFQETWASVVSHRDQYRPDGQFSAWLFRIAHHKLMDHFRQHHVGLQSLDDVLDAPTTAQDPTLSEQHRQVHEAIARLPFLQREALLLQQKGFSLADIASIVDEPQETVKSRLRYGFQKLKTEMEATRP